MVTVFEGDIQYLGFIGRWLLGQTYAYYGNVINSTFGYFALLAESFTYPCGESALLFLCFYGGIVGSVKESAQKELSEHWVKEIGVATKDHTLPVQTLSGGNQQKVVLARWLATHPKILILNGPTVGVDIGAKYDIHKLLRELAKQGMAVLVVSDDVAEITALCDRALIMKAGSMTGEFTGEDLTDDNLYKSTI